MRQYRAFFSRGKQNVAKVHFVLLFIISLALIGQSSIHGVQPFMPHQSPLKLPTSPAKTGPPLDAKILNDITKKYGAPLGTYVPLDRVKGLYEVHPEMLPKGGNTPTWLHGQQSIILGTPYPPIVVTPAGKISILPSGK